MKLMMFAKGQGTSLGLVDGATVIDLAAADGALPTTLQALIEAGPSATARLKAATANAPAHARLPLASVKPALPIAQPPKFVCVGLNYLEHAKEGGHAPPTYPSFFPRWSNSLVPAEAPVVRPKCSIQLDYECELT
ncbi:MAG: fumarylacetoacetate hydrolase family protein, partial [Hyphomicrobiaceae bacterium]